MAAYHANPVAEEKWSESTQYISKYIFQKYLDTSADNNVPLGTYKSWYSPKCFVWNLCKFF